MTHVTGLNGIPDGPHFAIITTTDIYIPGDERSRTNPGHGYPEHTETSINYDVYQIGNEESWKAQIAHLTKNKTPFKAIRATTATVTTTVHVAVE